MPYGGDRGEKPNSILGYYRDFYAKYKDDPSMKDHAAEIKPLLDMLDAAAAGKQTTTSIVPALDRNPGHDASGQLISAINTLTKSDFTQQPPASGYIDDRDAGKLVKVSSTTSLAPALGAHAVTIKQDPDAAAKGIGAYVNGHAIYWDKLATDEPNIGLLLSHYQGDTLKQRLAGERYIRRDIAIDHELILECAAREGYRVPQENLDERVNYGIKGFHGDKVAFVKNLQKHGQTLEQFNEFNRDEIVIGREDDIHREAPIRQFIHEHFDTN